MDVWALNLNSGGGFALGTTRKGGLVAAVRQSATTGWRVVASDEFSAGGGVEVRLSARRSWRSPPVPRHRSIVVRSIGKRKNHDGSSSSEEDGIERTNQEDDKAKSDSSAKKPEFVLSDWRDFRAHLVAREQDQPLDSDNLTKDTVSSEPMLGLKWAHPISVPETGCVLVATEKLDGVESFERTVVLLLRLGSRDPREGPFGVILNKPLQKKIKDMKLSNPHLATTFADCSLHRGGPLDANMFLLNTGDGQPLPAFEKVVSGICFGARNSLDEATALVKRGVIKAQDFRFFIGYAGWQFDQLLDEIESNYWVVAACSSHLISGASADSSSELWEEILQLMGGQYSELSRKPKPGNS